MVLGMVLKSHMFRIRENFPGPAWHQVNLTSNRQGPLLQRPLCLLCSRPVL